MRKGEIACNKQFLLFSQCFLPLHGTYFSFLCSLKMLSATCFNLDKFKILSSGNGLNPSRASVKKIVQLLYRFIQDFTHTLLNIF